MWELEGTRGDREPKVILQFYVLGEAGEWRRISLGEGKLEHCPPLHQVPFSSRKQLKRLQKVPLRPPRILSFCHLKTMWTRECPGPCLAFNCP